MPLNEMESRNVMDKPLSELMRESLDQSTTNQEPDVEISRTVEIGPGASPEFPPELEIEIPDFEMTVGDVSSEEMGTAARANGGKAAFDLMPLEQLAYLLRHDVLMFSEANTVDAADVLDVMGQFQRNECDAWKVLLITTTYHLFQQPPAIFEKQDTLGALEDVCHVWDYGRKKYAEWNWAKGAPWSVPVACLVRHLRLQIIDPEGVDGDSGFSHTAHMVCNAMMLVHYAQYWDHRAPEADNRPYQYFQKSE